MDSQVARACIRRLTTLSLQDRAEDRAADSAEEEEEEEMDMIRRRHLERGGIPLALVAGLASLDPVVGLEAITHLEETSSKHLPLANATT